MEILIVDDSPDILEIVEIVLSSDGWGVRTAASIAAANAELAKGHPQAMLVDFQLPDGDGLSAARSWKGDPSTAAIPIILYTGANESDVTCEPDLLKGVVSKLSDPFGLSQKLRELLS